jgi:hypothetical protein
MEIYSIFCGEAMNIELAGCEALLMEEIGNPKMKRRDVAQTYALTLMSSDRDTVDWPKVNHAIMERWSKSGLIWIKKQACSCKCFPFAGKP